MPSRKFVPMITLSSLWNTLLKKKRSNFLFCQSKMAMTFNIFAYVLLRLKKNGHLYLLVYYMNIQDIYKPFTVFYFLLCCPDGVHTEGRCPEGWARMLLLSQGVWGEQRPMAPTPHLAPCWGGCPGDANRTLKAKGPLLHLYFPSRRKRKTGRFDKAHQKGTGIFFFSVFQRNKEPWFPLLKTTTAFTCRACAVGQARRRSFTPPVVSTRGASKGNQLACEFAVFGWTC